ncbi:hypothetical protein K7X08_027608 [Anisodus acutangulus]|uniref:Mannan endo-1,4-beta-mannosidase n=1 Tax=Anisodus acutangulus TaxID=402998 RepID=A0A9Q1RIE1_9SOLA|nr:hypothetical protein K7X08_027608 [Anisodus acutangulus]
MKLLVVHYLFIISSCYIFNFSYGRNLNPNFRVKAVNLGGWLVTEGWIKPSLFDAIPNNDFLSLSSIKYDINLQDGTGLQFKSVTEGKYLCAELGGGNIIVANRTAASGWETFKIWRINSTIFNFRVFNKEFVGVDGSGNVVAVENKPGFSETFEIVRNSDDPSRGRRKSTNGFLLQVKTEELVTADHSGGNGGWGDDDPSVFIMKTSGRLEGEFQITNGYGPIMASQVMREHWRTFIVEEDFSFIKSNGLNAVRIPVGWWIASDPTPPKPYVGGSLNALDNAFLWARYAKNPSLYAVELINEPLAPEVTLDMVKKYYQAGYNAVRKHSSTAYVVMSNRLSSDPTELLTFASGLKGSVIDVHYYNFFSRIFDNSIFDNMSVQQNLEFVNTNRSAELNTVTQSNGLLTFVGEWVAEWEVRDATKEDYQKFAQAQLEVFGRATFGWAYWTLKNVNNHWSEIDEGSSNVMIEYGAPWSKNGDFPQHD